MFLATTHVNYGILRQNNNIKFYSKNLKFRNSRRQIRTSSLIHPELEPEGEDSNEDIIYILTNSGIVKIPTRTKTITKPNQTAIQGRLLPSPIEQGICIAGTFWVVASNGIDLKRKMHFQGFCQSPDILCECVEDTVLDKGGAVFNTKKLLKGGIHEFVKMDVAIPLLFGIPPQAESLKSAIELGGGLLDKVYGQWYIY